jgi:hypothetical protein
MPVNAEQYRDYCLDKGILVGSSLLMMWNAQGSNVVFHRSGFAPSPFLVGPLAAKTLESVCSQVLQASAVAAAERAGGGAAAQHAELHLEVALPPGRDREAQAGPS